MTSSQSYISTNPDTTPATSSIIPWVRIYVYVVLFCVVARFLLFVSGVAIVSITHFLTLVTAYHGACYVAATGKYPEDGQQGAHPCSCTFCRYCEMVPPSVNEEQKECSWVFLVQPTRLFLQCPHNPPCFPSANKLVYIMSVPLTGPAPTRAVSSDIIDAAKVECYRAIQSMTHPDYYAQRIQIRHSNLNRLLW